MLGREIDLPLDTLAALVAVGLAILPVALVLGVERGLRDRLLRRTLIAIARWNEAARREEALPSPLQARDLRRRPSCSS